VKLPWEVPWPLLVSLRRTVAVIVAVTHACKWASNYKASLVNLIALLYQYVDQRSDVPKYGHPAQGLLLTTLPVDVVRV
jgi:hypothetical protein